MAPNALLCRSLLGADRRSGEAEDVVASEGEAGLEGAVVLEDVAEVREGSVVDTVADMEVPVVPVVLADEAALLLLASEIASRP